jgi:hypothetical protein
MGVEDREKLLRRSGHGVALRLEIAEGLGAKGLQGVTGEGLKAPSETVVKNHI